MRIALVNDLKIALVALRQIVVQIAGAEVAWEAEDGEQALRHCEADTPDLILMDLVMPVMDGVEATRRIMQTCPCPILVVTATVTGNSDRVYKALGHGALDAIDTPVLGGGDLSGGEYLMRKIRMIERLTAPAPQEANTRPPAGSADIAKPSPAAMPIVAIGASTGGPRALVELLSGLSRPLGCAVAIVQHLDSAFAPGLATWLGGETHLPVALAESQQLPAEGTVVVACTDDHLILDAGGRFRYVSKLDDHIHRPSVDVFFGSLVETSVTPGIAVLLTGMGRNGASGLQELRQAGWHTIAQDKATSVIWGMPGAAVGLNAAVETLPIQEIGPAINRWLLQHPSAKKGKL